VVRGAHSTLDVQGIPPKTSPRWSIDQVDVSFGTWSPDDSKLVYHEMTDDEGESPTIGIFDPATGKNLPFDVHGKYPPQLTWESNSALLIRARVESVTPKTYQDPVHAGGRLREGRSLDDRAGRLDHPGHPAQRLTGQRD
jgi:hypothetical protein